MANGESLPPKLVISEQEAAQLLGATEKLKMSERAPEGGSSALSPIHEYIRTAVTVALDAEWRMYRMNRTVAQKMPSLDTVFAELQQYFQEKGTYMIERVNARTGTMHVKISLPPDAREHPNFITLMNVVKYASLLLNRLAQAQGRVTTLERECTVLQNDIQVFQESIATWRQKIANGASQEKIRDMQSAIDGTEGHITRMTASQTEKEVTLQRARERLAQYKRTISEVLPDASQNQGQDGAITDAGALAQKLEAATAKMKSRGDISNEHLAEDITPDFTIAIQVEVEPESATYTASPSLPPALRRSQEGPGSAKSSRKKRGNGMTVSLSALALVGLIGGAVTLMRKGDTAASAPSVTTSSLMLNTITATNEEESEQNKEPWMNEDQMRRAGRQMFDKFQKQHGGLNFKLHMQDKTEKRIILTVNAPEILKGLTSHGELITVSFRRGEMTIRTTENGKEVATFDPAFNGIVVSHVLQNPDALIRVPYTVSVEGHSSVQDEVFIRMEDINSAAMTAIFDEQKK